MLLATKRARLQSPSSSNEDCDVSCCGCSIKWVLYFSFLYHYIISSPFPNFSIQSWILHVSVVWQRCGLKYMLSFFFFLNYHKDHSYYIYMSFYSSTLQIFLWKQVLKWMSRFSLWHKHTRRLNLAAAQILFPLISAHIIKFLYLSCFLSLIQISRQVPLVCTYGLYFWYRRKKKKKHVEHIESFTNKKNNVKCIIQQYKS